MLHPPARLDQDLRQALIALSLTQVIVWGSLFYAFTLCAPKIVTETGWSDTLVFGGFSLMLLVSGLVAPWVGRWIDSHGGRVPMSLGAVLSALGMAILALSHHPATYSLAWIIIGLAFALSAYNAAFAALVVIDGERGRKAISIVTLAGGLASTVFWPLTEWLLTFLDWRQIYLAYALLNLLLCLPLHGLGLRAVHNHGLHTGKAKQDETAITEHNGWYRLIVGLLVLAFICHGMAMNAVAVHMIPALRAMGMDGGAVVIVGMLIGPAQVLSRALELFFGQSHSPMLLGIIAMALFPVAFLVWLVAPFGLAAMAVFGILYGMGNGLGTIVRGTLPLHLFGSSGYGGFLGWLSMPALVAQALAPSLYAVLESEIGAIKAFAVAGIVMSLPFVFFLMIAGLRRKAGL